MPSQMSVSELDTAILMGKHLADTHAQWKQHYKPWIEAGRPGDPPAAPRDKFPCIEPVDPQTIGADPDTFQFRTGSDENGVTKERQLKGPWDPARAGIGIIFEYADGRRYIVDGHHRLNYAQNHSEEKITINVEVLREKDGYTPAVARAIGAMKNLAEGEATVQEVAQQLGVSEELLRERWQHHTDMKLPPSHPKGPSAEVTPPREISMPGPAP